MERAYKSLSISAQHLVLLNQAFMERTNYSDEKDFEIYIENLQLVSDIGDKIGLPEELYSYQDRQMKLADIIEYMFFSRGIFTLINNQSQLMKQNIPYFLELIMRFVNLLMVYEIMTIDNKMRNAFLDTLSKGIKDVPMEEDFTSLRKWNKWVGLTEKETPKGAPSAYFDSLLPKTAGGLWHEMLVYAFLLRFNVGYIFPLLLHQKVISLDQKLSPPDIIILHKKTNRYYGIEVGNLKERQSGGFMAPTGIPVIPLDTLNCRISDRCPTCKKWIGICPKVINDFSNCEYKIGRIEIRCLYDCDKYSLDEKLGGKCLYMKYYDKLHYHYRCLVNKEREGVISDIISKHRIEKAKLIEMIEKKEKNLPFEPDNIRSKKINYLKTHYLWYQELSKLI